MMRLEVRCCCDPSILFGHLDVRELQVKAGGLVHFTVHSAKPVDVRGDDWLSPTVDVTTHEVTLMVRTFWNAGKVYPALSSEETPIEKLRLLPGFQEARATFGNVYGRDKLVGR